MAYSTVASIDVVSAVFMGAELDPAVVIRENIVVSVLGSV